MDGARLKLATSAFRGTPSTLPWSVAYLNANSYAPIDGVARHPDQYYELVGDLLIA